MIKVSQSQDTLEWELATTPCNEIGSKLLGEFETLLSGLKKNPPKALIIHSSIPGGFSAGADLRELYQEVLVRPKDQAMKDLEHFLNRIHRVMNTIDTLPFPTLGVVHGVCFGGGFELALTCDVLVADHTARFCFPELRLGIIPGFGGIPRLKREVGNALIRDLLLTGRSIGAEKAQTLGLVSQVVNPGRALDVARKMAMQMSRFDGHAVQKAKSFTKSLPLDELENEKQIFLNLFQDPDVIKNLKRFVENSDVRPYLS